jgi:hypothetical protein
MQLIPQVALIKTSGDILTVQYRPLLSYRGSGVFTVSDAEVLRQGEQTILRIEGGNGTIVTLTVFPISADSAVVLPKIDAGPAVAPDSHDALGSLSYALEVSKWTYEAIMRIVGDSNE